MNHRPGPAPVKASVPLLVDGVDAAVVAPVDVDPVAAAVVAAEVLAVTAAAAVGDTSVGAGTNVIFAVACLPPASPNAITHEAPAVS